MCDECLVLAWLVAGRITLLKGLEEPGGFGVDRAVGRPGTEIGVGVGGVGFAVRVVDGVAADDDQVVEIVVVHLFVIHDLCSVVALCDAFCDCIVCAYVYVWFVCLDF